jgi:predicted N-acetyltransferase YhbS
MSLILRPGKPGDAEACGAICFQAFKSISSEHNFPWDLPSAEVGIGLMQGLLSNPGFYSVVAEVDGKTVGSNFLDERSSIAGVGPITVDPTVQNQGIGRRLMLAVLERSAERRFAGVRLVQSAYHNRSLCLYTKLGFESREALSKIDGAPLGIEFLGYDVRPVAEADVARCNALCERIHGHHRGGEPRNAIAQGTARVVEHLGEITAYASDIAFFGHAVAETNQGLKALIGAASAFPAGGFLLPTRNRELFRWCLCNKLRLVHQMTLMTIGLYNERRVRICPRCYTKWSRVISMTYRNPLALLITTIYLWSADAQDKHALVQRLFEISGVSSQIKSGAQTAATPIMDHIRKSNPALPDGTFNYSPYPARAGCATGAGSRRMRLAPSGRVVIGDGGAFDGAPD